MDMKKLMVIMLFLTGSLTACTTTRMVQPPLRNADVYPNAQTIAGLTVAVDEIFDPDRVKRYFGIDLTKEDILPVNIIFSNQGDDRFLVKPSGILLTEGNSVIDAMPVDAVEALVRDRSRPVADVVMQETVVQPLGNYQGVLFFKTKRADAVLYGEFENIFSSRLAVRVVVTDQDSGERILFGPYALSGL